MRRFILGASVKLELTVIIVFPVLPSTQFKLCLGAEGNDPPFSQIGADGKVAGFDGMVVAPVTMTVERKRAVDFEKSRKAKATALVSVIWLDNLADRAGPTAPAIAHAWQRDRAGAARDRAGQDRGAGRNHRRRPRRVCIIVLHDRGVRRRGCDVWCSDCPARLGFRALERRYLRHLA